MVYILYSPKFVVGHIRRYRLQITYTVYTTSLGSPAKKKYEPQVTSHTSHQLVGGFICLTCSQYTYLFHQPLEMLCSVQASRCWRRSGTSGTPRLSVFYCFFVGQAGKKVMNIRRSSMNNSDLEGLIGAYGCLIRIHDQLEWQSIFWLNRWWFEYVPCLIVPWISYCITIWMDWPRPYMWVSFLQLFTA